jgi:hypothetical protein
LVVPSSTTLDLRTSTALASLPAGANLQFTTIDIVGTLYIPSGTVLRATGDVNISGIIFVSQNVADNGTNRPPLGVAASAAGAPQGGVAVPVLQAASLLYRTPGGGGAGARNANNTGGDGGGSLMILTRGNFTLAGSGFMRANGANATNASTTGVGIPGSGGGGGGVFVLAAKGNMTLTGTIQANGGNGSAGSDGDGGNGEGGGGGGGGGIVHALSSSTAFVNGTIQTLGGNPGANAGTGTLNPGGGGGASGGNGGGGGSTNPASTPSAGAAGQFFRTVVASPENLLL